MLDSRIDEICERFENAFQHNRDERIEQWLQEVAPGERGVLLDQLLQIELELLLRDNCHPDKNEYLVRFAVFPEQVESAFQLARQRLEQSNAGKDEQDPALTATHVPSGPTVTIRVISGPEQGTEWKFSEHASFIAGRAEQSNICLSSDRALSRFHCRIEIQPPQCMVIDLASSNGTKVNGKPIEQAIVRDGDIVKVGNSELKISIQQPNGEEWAYAPTAVPGRDLSQSTVDTDQAEEFTEVPGYQLIEEIGKGGMGAVYRSVQLGSGLPVAIKIMHPAMQKDDGAFQRFVREASTALSLKHKRIVECLEFGLTGNSPFLVMEYLDCCSLFELLDESDLKDRIRIAAGVMLRVLDALQFAHDRQIVHRDLKPSNLLIFRKNRKLQVKLADFGLAKNFHNAGFGDLTKSDEVFGTAAYMSPEQIVDCRYAKPSCDIYSAGVCLYNMLTGKLPYYSAVIPELVGMILDSEPIPIHEHEPRLPQNLVAVVDRALRREPADRFLSAEDMAEALKPFTVRQKG